MTKRDMFMIDSPPAGPAYTERGEADAENHHPRAARGLLVGRVTKERIASLFFQDVKIFIECVGLLRCPRLLPSCWKPFFPFF